MFRKLPRRSDSGIKLFLLPRRTIHSRLPLKRCISWMEHQNAILSSSSVLPKGILGATLRSFNTTAFRYQKDEGDDKKKKENEEEEARKAVILKFVIGAVNAYIVWMLFQMFVLERNDHDPETTLRYVSWNEFVHFMLAKGEVEEIILRPGVDVVTVVLHDDAVVKGRKVEHKVFHVNVPDIDKFEMRLRDAEQKLGIPSSDAVPIVYERYSSVAGRILFSLIMFAILLSILSKRKGGKGFMSQFDMFSSASRAKFTLIDSTAGQGRGVRFRDVAGLKEAKQEVMEFVDYLKRPERYNFLGAKPPKGALLLGPPGCGKTLLAKAVATEAGVPFLSMNGSEFIEMIGGLGAARVRDLFKEARNRLPCIIYIDEIDAIGRTRSDSTLDMGGGEAEQTLNQLLVEMDGMATKEGVIVLASTNRADVLDKALLRPGRFDRHIMIELPNMAERKEIFEEHLKGIVLEHKPSYYSPRMASLTPGFSGADIANVCNEAALHAARLKTSVVTGGDLEYAVERVVGGIEKKSQAISPAEKEVVAYHESGHALVGWLLKNTDALLKVTIVPRTNQALGFAQYTPTDKRLYSEDELFERICMALGGRVAESVVFNRITTGAQNDLQKVTKIAYGQIRSFGMNPIVGHLSFPDNETEFGTRPYSKKLASIIDEQARVYIAKAYRRTEELLSSNRDKLEMLARALLKKETLNYQDVVELIGPPAFKDKNLVEPVQFEAMLNEQAGVQPGRMNPPPPTED